MARPRGFDPDHALEQATQAFWAKGFENTSLDELCEATGLGRSSLYAAFGDKRALYLRALERYEEATAARIAAALAVAPVRRAVERFLRGMVDDIVAGPGRRGCFIGNCAAEMARLDRGAAARVRASLARIEGAFREGLDKARARGELSAGADTTALARFLTAGIQGLRLVGKANPDRAALNDITRMLLCCLDFQGED
ncbi:MAG TPA: TetR family transcriptional regulator C-terminal domain-containing protein [Burkholderiales bacterium]